MKHKNTIENSGSYRLTFQNIFWAMLLFFFASENSFAQTAPQLTSWNIAPNSVNFISTPTVGNLPTTDYPGLSADYMTNSISDASGNIVFFVVDGTIYDKDGYRIDEFKRLGINLTEFSQEISIIPIPGTCSSYYLVFGIRVNLSGGGISYFPVFATLDLTAQNINYPLDPNKKGALQYNPAGTSNVTDLGNITPIPNIFTAYSLHKTNRFGIATTSYRAATNDYILFVHGDQGLLSYTINTAGISFLNAPFGYDGGGLPIGFEPTSGDNPDNLHYTEMEIVQLTNGNYRIGKILGNRNVCLADINPVTISLITGTEKYFVIPSNFASSTTSTQITGLEFSPDGQRLYYASSNNITTSGSPVGFLNLALATPVHTPITFSGISNLHACQIEMAHDNKMYFNGGSQLYALTNPNTTPVASNWSASVALTPTGFNKLMPDQLDGNIYNTAATVLSYTASTSALFPSTTQIWTPTNNPFGGTAFNPVGTAANPILVLDKIVIPPGFNITIQGMTFKFKARSYDPITNIYTAGASVKVLRSTSALAGARLTLTALGTTPSVFSSDNICSNGMWEGIEVEGISTASQGAYSGASAGKQAWLRIMNSSVVEHAYHAVVMARVLNPINGVPTYPIVPTVDLTYAGGSVQVTNGSRFRNNYIDVYFGNYDYLSTSIDNNNSSFDNCFFETTTSLLDPTLNLVNWFHHVLVGVKGIAYNGVTFQNTDVLNPVYDITLNKRGTGLFSINSYFTVARRFFPPFNRGQFNNLTYGVYAANFGSTKTFTISECNFNDNYRGVYVGSVNYEKINSCKFFVNRRAYTTPLPDISADAAYGIYLDFSRGFMVQENEFSYAGATSPMANSFGVIVNQSNLKRNCGQHDEIYKNTFHDILAGGRAQGNNSEQDVNPFTLTDNQCYLLTDPTRKNYIGLEFLCNNFTNNITNSDLSVTRSQNLVTSGNVAYLQGDFSSSTLTPAGNTFSHTSGAFDFYSQTFPTDVNGTVVYVHHTGALTTPNTFVLPPVQPAPCSGCGTYTASGSCPTKLGVRSPLLLRQEMISFDNQKNILEAKIDGGNTNYLLQQIYSNASAGSLKNLLQSKSPFLSDRVLIAYITKFGVPSGHIKDIVIANSPLTAPVMDALNTVNLPNGIRNQINNAQTGVSGRTKLESEISYYTKSKAYNVDELIRVFSNDSTLEYGVDSILTVFKTYNIPEATNEIIKAYLTKGDYANTISVNDSLRNAGTDPTFTDMIDVAVSLKQSAEKEALLLDDASLKQRVEDLAAMENKQEAPSASAILKFLFSYFYNEYIEPVSWDVPNRSMIAIDNNEQAISNFNVFPNPSNGIINFEYTLQEEEVGEIQIFDVAGKFVQSVQLSNTNNTIKFNGENLDAGTYFYKFSINGNITETNRFVIIK